MSVVPSISTAAADDGIWTRYQKWLVFLTAITIVFDGIDNQLLGITIPALIADWHVARSAFAPVVSLGFVGMIVGAIGAGFWGDRAGRRVALLTSIAVFGVCTLAVAFVHDVPSLAACASRRESDWAARCPTRRRSRRSTCR